MSEKVEPITPKEAMEEKLAMIPDFVILAFNTLIQENLTSNGTATVYQKEAIAKIIKMSRLISIDCKISVTKDHIMAKNWLDIEQLYRNKQWYVTYHPKRPDTDGYFVFESKQKL